jgi:hypothetical protein
MTLGDNIRASMLRRGYAGFSSDYANKVVGIQARRRGLSDSKQFAPLQISVPPVASLYEFEGRFENPRIAPQPQGLAFNARQGTATPPPKAPSLATTPGTFSGYGNNVGTAKTVEVKNISQASVFSLPKFDPEREMRKLQNLWTRRGSILLSPILRRSPSPRPRAFGSFESEERREVSFFEDDSESDCDDEIMMRRLRISRWR